MTLFTTTTSISSFQYFVWFPLSLLLPPPSPPPPLPLIFYLTATRELSPASTFASVSIYAVILLEPVNVTAIAMSKYQLLCAMGFRAESTIRKTITRGLSRHSPPVSRVPLRLYSRTCGFIYYLPRLVFFYCAPRHIPKMQLGNLVYEGYLSLD